MATGNFWDGFRRWRRSRPFWGSLFLLVSGLELLYTANSDLGGIQIHIGPSGFLSYVLPLTLIVCAVLCLVSPAQRLFYGVVGIIAALYSFIGINLGGLLLGMLLGILGGALVIAWGPPRVAPGAGLIDEPADGEPAEPADQRPADLDATQQIEIAGHDDRPDHEPAHPRGFVPGFTGEEPPREPRRFGRNPKSLVLLLIPLAVTATLLVAGSHAPASADETCPEGLPSRSYATSAPATASAATAARKKAAPKATLKAGSARTKKVLPLKSKTSSPSSAVTADGGAGQAVLDGLNDVVGGVGNLLGLGEESPSPSGSPSPPETTPAAPTAEPTVEPTVEPTKTAEPTVEPTKTVAPEPTGTTPPATTAATAAPTASDDDVIPCLGPRVIGKVGDSNDIPRVANKPGLMEVKKLELFKSTYDGVVDMPTAAGSYKALKFSMERSINTPFSLTVDKPNGRTVKVTSDRLVTDGKVKIYTSELRGKLFGVFPVVFDPEHPPPLTLPYLVFTDVTIQLGYVRCDLLTGDPLRINVVS